MTQGAQQGYYVDTFCTKKKGHPCSCSSCEACSGKCGTGMWDVGKEGEAKTIGS